MDLTLIHWPSPGDEVPMEEYLGALREAQKEGLTDHIGISNFTCAQMDQAKAILGDTPIFTNQVEVHPSWPTVRWWSMPSSSTSR